MKKIFFASMVFLVTCSVNAQFIYDYLKAADNYYQKGDYFSAAQYYEKYFGSDKAKDRPEYKPYAVQTSSKKTAPAATSRETAIWRLAESYRLLNYPAKAAPYYKQAMELDKTKFPLASYHYATMQRALENYSDAEAHFKTFLAEYTTDDEYRKGAQTELANLQFIQAQLNKKDLKYYTVNKAPSVLNTVGANYAPAWLNATTLLFTSTRPEDSTAKDKIYTNKLYQAVYSEGTLADIQKATLPQDKDMHQGVVSATPDGKTLFLTRWSVQGNKKTAAIYSSTSNGNAWSSPSLIGTDINVAGANTQQPFVTADGKYLLYSSDRSGGLGGFDIWYAPLDGSGRPGAPVNMGDVINTSRDEQAPFYHEASKSLVFSSNGRVGMGGYDFFVSKGAVGSFAAPENFGYPVNSVKDDIYFTSRGGAKNILEEVMMSSDREAACCLEMFYLKKIRPLKQLGGRIVSCDPAKTITGATVTVVDATTTKTLHTTTVGADGGYTFTLEDHVAVKVKGDAQGFITNTIDVAMPADPEDERMNYPDLCLQPEAPKVNETFVVENVYYDFNKAVLKPESFPALDEIVRMLTTYPEMVIELSAHTDQIGSNSYNQKLSEARARSVVAYLISKGIDENRLAAKGYGETMPIEPNKNPDGTDNPTGREKNRRTEFKVLKN
ncbi:MAG: OmpA family protein [Chitinophagaceae bacterium]|nr:OmpA family protein [Chitinophagaceae bacterium]